MFTRYDRRPGMPLLASLLLAMLAATGSCINMGGGIQSKFEGLTPGMTPTEVSGTVGSPDAIVGEVVTAYGQRVVVWEYEKLTRVIPTEHTVYWVYLVDGHYRKCTLRGDWQKESKLIYRTDFSAPQND
jgi:hypothetical protein